MTLSYSAKARLVIYALPVVLLCIFAVVSYPEAKRLFTKPALPTGVGITTSKPQYHSGEKVTVFIYNSSSLTVYIQNDCPNEPLTVYKFVQGKWVQLNATASISKCKGEPRDYEIASAHVIPVDYSYWPSLFAQPGYYRIAATFEADTGEADTTFTVTP